MACCSARAAILAVLWLAVRVGLAQPLLFLGICSSDASRGPLREAARRSWLHPLLEATGTRVSHRFFLQEAASGEAETWRDVVAIPNRAFRGNCGESKLCRSGASLAFALKWGQQNSAAPFLLVVDHDGFLCGQNLMSALPHFPQKGLMVASFHCGRISTPLDLDETRDTKAQQHCKAVRPDQQFILTSRDVARVLVDTYERSKPRKEQSFVMAVKNQVMGLPNLFDWRYAVLHPAHNAEALLFQHVYEGPVGGLYEHFCGAYVWLHLCHGKDVAVFDKIVGSSRALGVANRSRIELGQANMGLASHRRQGRRRAASHAAQHWRENRKRAKAGQPPELVAGGGLPRKNQFTESAAAAAAATGLQQPKGKQETHQLEGGYSGLEVVDIAQLPVALAAARASGPLESQGGRGNNRDGALDGAELFERAVKLTSYQAKDCGGATTCLVAPPLRAVKLPDGTIIQPGACSGRDFGFKALQSQSPPPLAPAPTQTGPL